MFIAKVLLPAFNLFPFDYAIPSFLSIQQGDIVWVPFRNKECMGVVWEIAEDTSINKKIKEIITKYQDLSFNKVNIDFINKASEYYMTSLGSMLKLALPFELLPINKNSKVKTVQYQHSTAVEVDLPALTPAQQSVFNEINSVSIPSVLKGVTGSGKTEIYFSLIAEYLKRGSQILLMLPEIALSQQIIDRFISRFQCNPVIWHSSISKAKKYYALMSIIKGEAKIIIGTRSSLFLPYKQLDLIIVDEEHDSSYKQEEGILYNARDMAILRAKLSHSKVLLGSATPSIETFHNSQLGKYQLHHIYARYNNAYMPSIAIIDMRKAKRVNNKSWLSEEVVRAINDTLIKKEQVLLFLNRRGYAPLILCKNCGYRFACSSCSSWLVFHKNANKLDCHHCGYSENYCELSSCPECHEEDGLIACGPGIERVEEEIQLLFPSSNIVKLSKEDTHKPKLLQETLQQMSSGKIDILIGTQIVTKGYHFPNLTLVVIIDADMSLSNSDMRTSERSFQLLEQVGGRAGREHHNGKVLIQTYYPEHQIFTTIKNNLQDEFISYELETRKQTNFPPFSRMVAIVFMSSNEHQALMQAKELRDIMLIHKSADMKIFGPAKALVFKVAGKYRYKILLFVDKKMNVQKYLKYCLSLVKTRANCKIRIDIDPQS